VDGGRDIAPLINSLLDMPAFVTRIATQDYHPADHISFADNHPAPNNQPFKSYIEMQNPVPGKAHETKPQLLWPVHCVAASPGAAIIPEIDHAGKVDIYAKKGMDSRVEMYSVFSDAFGNLDPALARKSVDTDVQTALNKKGVTDVFVVGLAGDYCVKYTAIDAARAGFRSWVIEDGTKCVDPGPGWVRSLAELREKGVSVVKSDGPEVARLKSRG
jgi:nicotinamidase-related amidase